MPAFSKHSAEKLATCDERLQRLFNKVVETADCAILWGFRNEVDQDECFAIGTSKAKWPDSPHNVEPSHAVDVMPVPIDWNDWVRLRLFVEFVKKTAAELGIAVRWGGDFKSIKDGDHWELVNP